MRTETKKKPPADDRDQPFVLSIQADESLSYNNQASAAVQSAMELSRVLQVAMRCCLEYTFHSHTKQAFPFVMGRKNVISLFSVVDTLQPQRSL